MNKLLFLIIIVIISSPVFAISIRPVDYNVTLRAGTNYIFNFTLVNRLEYSSGNAFSIADLSLLQSSQNFSPYIIFSSSSIQIPNSLNGKTNFFIILSIPSNYSIGNYRIAFRARPSDFYSSTSYLDDSSVVIYVKPEATATIFLTVNETQNQSSGGSNSNSGSSVSSGGSSGSKGAVSDSSVTSSTGNIINVNKAPIIVIGKKDEVRSLDIKDSVITRMMLGFKEDASVSFIVKELPDTQVHITEENIVSVTSAKKENTNFEIKQFVYKYLEITPNSSSVSNSIINFKVSKSYLISNDIEASTVRLNRYDNNKSWIELKTEKINEDDSYIYYQTENNHFSTFAITGQKILTKPIFNETKTGPTLPEKIINITQINNTSPEFLPLWIIGILIVIILIVLIFVLPKIKGNYIRHG